MTSKWEYVWSDWLNAELLQIRISEFTQAGWELAATHYNSFSGQFKLFFKRPISKDS